MKREKRGYGWWSIAVAAAVLAPALGPRSAAAGPFDYVKKADEQKNGGHQDPPRSPAPVQRDTPRPAPQPQASSNHANPFGYIPPQRPNTTRVPSYPVNPPTPPPPAYRESPFGTVRRGVAPPVFTPAPHIETPQQPRTAPGTGSPPSPGVTNPWPFGTVRRQPESGTAVTPLPRGGHGSLGSYFGRDPHRQRDREGGYYPDPYYGDGYYRDAYGRYVPYPPGYYYYPSPYDLYPPTVIYPQPSVPPVVIVPEPEVVVVPEPGAGGAERRVEPEVGQAATLDDVIQDIEEAWESRKLSLLMRHVRQDGDIQVYRDGEWLYSLSRADFEQKTEQAFRDYDTVSMSFEKPEKLSADEARARAEHVYKTRSGEKQRVHVTYAFRRYGRTWRVVGLDYEPTPKQRAEGAESSPLAAAVAPRTPAPAPAAAPGELRLVSAPPVRLQELLNAAQPRLLATVKWLRAGHRTLYTLKAMRGVAPGTVAWALYRPSEKRPAETGVMEVGARPARGWVAVRTLAPQLVAHSARATARGRAALLAARAFPDASLALVPAKPPAKAARRAGLRARARQGK